MGAISDILAGLVTDPTQPNGGWLLNLINPQAGKLAATNTPLAAPSSPGAPGGAPTPPPAAQNGGGLISQFFTPHRGLLGNSMVGDAVRGGLAGIGNSTGFTGLAAMGQGAMGGVEAGARRRENQIGSALAGQQYQQNQQQLVGGNIDIAQRVARYNIFAQMSGRPTITVQQAMSDPSALAQVMSASASAGPHASPSGGAQQPGASAGTGGMSPVLGGGGVIDPHVAAAYGPQAASFTPVSSAPQGNGGQGSGSTSGAGAPDLESGFRATHMGMGTADWADYGMQLLAAGDSSGQQMIKDASDANPDLLRQQARAKAQGQILNLRSGSVAYDPYTNQPTYQNPVAQSTFDTTTGRPGVKYVTPAMGEAGSGQGAGQGGATSAAAPGGGTSGDFTFQNNPGNLRPIGGTSGFQTFSTPEEGTAAMMRNLRAYGKKGINTVSDIVTTWAPPSDHNDTAAYVADVVRQTGLPPNQPLDLNNGRILTQLSLAMMNHEQGISPPPSPGQSVSPVSYGVSGAPGTPGQGANAADNNATGPSEADKTAMDIYAKQRTGIENAALATPVARQRVMAIMDAMKKYQSGHWSTELASIKAGLKAVGIHLPDNVLADPAQVQISLKNNFQAALAQISGFSSQPAAISLTQAQENFAHPDLQPEANLAIGAQAIGTFDWQIDMAKALKGIGGMQDPNQFAMQWQQTHPLQGYIDKAEKEIGSLQGMAGADRPKGVPSDAEKASDGKWYSPDPNRPGKFLMWQ